MLFSSNSAFSEIYKWVDESGKVHFGDRPVSSKSNETSEKVELIPSYVPGEGIPSEQIEAQKDFLRRKDEEREREKINAEKLAQDRKSRQEECEKIRKRLREITEVRMNNGRWQRPDYFVENGKPVSSDRQQEIIAELRRKVSRKCD